jgi:hypothetical protein
MPFHPLQQAIVYSPAREGSMIAATDWIGLMSELGGDFSKRTAEHD